MLTVEDHWPEGGLGEAVFSALAEAGEDFKAKLLAVDYMPASATPEEQLADAGLTSKSIARHARALVGAVASAR